MSGENQEMQIDKPHESILKDIEFTITLLERSVSSLETRFASRALRKTSSYRHLLTPEILKIVIDTYVFDSVLNKQLCSSIGVEFTLPSGKQRVPEIELFVGYLVVVYLSDQKQHQVGITTVTDLIERSRTFNRRTLDPIQAKLFFFFSHFHDSNGNLAQIQSFATLLNILLKIYLTLNLIDQADKLVSKAVFPETVGNNQFARYMYYLGRIKAIQLDYSTSHRHLLQAIRKAPQTPAAVGFQQTANKLSIIVQLLMGEIPERSLFRQESLRKALVPYLQITQAVREGDLGKFQDALAKHSDVFHADKNMTLILRLRHNVIKTGVRRISLSYSKISLKDICIKLQLDCEEDAEYIVAKAIRDGVIDATIDHESGSMKSNEIIDIYSTTEPQNAFNQRINFCLNLHNESVQAMRFPHGAHKKELAKAAELLEQERQFAKNIIDSEMDEDSDIGEF
ncbi:26S proteasome non-ATPase regulatory subunit [Boothiomyces macroporosus]|uniref:26S proteasome non-ATPase regulatory subunit n=1 Tax=Boothiomyces macroporosus TaxID=261099 RepID=A0AAD5ULV6_9FUNG|nr:26S proteasome non-ATPase regulatory subunit [Boothiomyces macroporosus]